MLEVFDIAGQEEYTSLCDPWIREGEGFVLVYSITSRASFSRIKTYFKHIQHVHEARLSSSSTSTYPGMSIPIGPSSPTSSRPAPVMLVANQIDRVTEREVSTQEGRALAKELGCGFVEASAKNCTNVEKAFYDVVRQLRLQRHHSGRMRGKQGPSSGGGHSDKENNKKRGPGNPSRPRCVIL